MNISTDDPRLTAFALSELDDAERDTIAEAVAADAALQKEVAQIQTLAGDLSSEFTQVNDSGAAGGLTAEQRAAITSASAAENVLATAPANVTEFPRTPKRRWLLPRKGSPWGNLIAASIVFVLLAGTIATQFGDTIRLHFRAGGERMAGDNTTQITTTSSTSPIAKQKAITAWREGGKIKEEKEPPAAPLSAPQFPQDGDVTEIPVDAPEVEIDDDLEITGTVETKDEEGDKLAMADDKLTGILATLRPSNNRYEKDRIRSLRKGGGRTMAEGRKRSAEHRALTSMKKNGTITIGGSVQIDAKVTNRAPAVKPAPTTPPTAGNTTTTETISIGGVPIVSVTKTALTTSRKKTAPVKVTPVRVGKRVAYPIDAPNEFGDYAIIMPTPNPINTAGERYNTMPDNKFRATTGEYAKSTFSIDVDTASYSNVRRFITENKQLPPPDAVRIEEMLNYFKYDYAAPEDTRRPFAAHVEVAGCPWNPTNRLVRIGLKGKVIAANARPATNLVFLVDVSGSMSDQNKLPLVKNALAKLTSRLDERDRISIVTYASGVRLALPATNGNQKNIIRAKLNSLAASGSTNGAGGIQLAYQMARRQFIKNGVNRVILCTDGDFNVGISNQTELSSLITRQAKTGVYLSVLGFGMGNYRGGLLEELSNKGNGNYAYIDNPKEAEKVLVEDMMGTLVTIAKDVKLQVEWNPATVSAYRLIGYANRVMANRDFRNDKKDAGEIGAGHTVTALYEVVPAGASTMYVRRNKQLKYQRVAATDEAKKYALTDAAKTGELCTFFVRYKPPTSSVALEFDVPVRDTEKSYAKASPDFKFAAAVAGFGMLLRNSPYAGNASLEQVYELATEGLRTPNGGAMSASQKKEIQRRGEFLGLVQDARRIVRQTRSTTPTRTNEREW